MMITNNNFTVQEFGGWQVLILCSVVFCKRIHNCFKKKLYYLGEDLKVVEWMYWIRIRMSLQYSHYEDSHYEDEDEF